MSTSRKTIPVAVLEFDDGGNTIWVHDAKGMTVLRLKCTGKIHVQRDCINLCAHADVVAKGDIAVCLPAKGKKEKVKSG